MTSNAIAKHFGNRLRVRVNGIYVEDDKILLIKHQGVGKKGYLWAPPGGGMEYGASAEDNLQREFKEETGIKVSVKEFLFICELLAPPLHALELFYRVDFSKGVLAMGYDPELSKQNQIIKALEFFSLEELKKIPDVGKHKILQKLNNLSDLFNKRGFFKL